MSRIAETHPDELAKTGTLPEVVVVGVGNVALVPPAVAGGTEVPAGAGVADPAPAATVTASFIPPLQWPITPQMK